MKQIIKFKSLLNHTKQIEFSAVKLVNFVLENRLTRGLFPKVCLLCELDLINEHQTKNKQLNLLCEKCCLEMLLKTGLKRFYVKVEDLRLYQKLGHAFYLWNFEGEVEILIKKYKFGRNYRLANLFAEFAYICIRNFNVLESNYASTKLETWDYLCPVPSSANSLRNKRFNHSLMLAKAISKRIGVVTSNNLLIASKERKNQADLNKSSRMKNIIGAFSANSKQVKDRKILLIDDICTTGATVTECCKTLYNSGARHVDIITLAKRELYEI